MEESESQISGSAMETDLNRARVLANLLDARFQILGFRFGLDAIVGLIPVAGDLASFLAGLYPLVLARKHGLGRATQVRMCINLAIDLVGGAIPLIGDVFDATYRANLKNLKLLEEAAGRARRG